MEMRLPRPRLAPGKSEASRCKQLSALQRSGVHGPAQRVLAEGIRCLELASQLQASVVASGHTRLLSVRPHALPYQHGVGPLLDAMDQQTRTRVPVVHLHQLEYASPKCCGTSCGDIPGGTGSLNLCTP